KTGSIPNFSLEPRLQNDYFGLVFTGYLQINQAGNYTFYTKSDDGSKLFINQQQVVENDGLHGARETSGTLYLTAGKHPLELRYFERSGTSDLLEVSYAGPGLSKTLIPDAVLFTEG